MGAGMGGKLGGRWGKRRMRCWLRCALFSLLLAGRVVWAELPDPAKFAWAVERTGKSPLSHISSSGMLWEVQP